MSHRHIDVVNHGHHNFEDISSGSLRLDRFFSQSLASDCQPLSHRQIRPSQSNSTLADSIRALRGDHGFPACVSSSPTSSVSTAAEMNNPPRCPTKPTVIRASGSIGTLTSPRKHTDDFSRLNQGISPLENSKTWLRDGLQSSSAQTSISLQSLSHLPATPRQHLGLVYSPFCQSPMTEQPRLLETSVLSRKPLKASISYSQFYAQLRNSSLPISLPMSGPSPPLSPASSMTTGPDIGSVMSHNLSNSSSISSVASSNSAQVGPVLSLKPCRTMSEDVEFDPNSFVAQFESVEAALLQLWNQKQSQAHQNQQLWRVIEKQRSIIFGQQEDLDKACRDREKLGQKLKHHLSIFPVASLLSSHRASVIASDYPATGHENATTKTHSSSIMHTAALPALSALPASPSVKEFFLEETPLKDASSFHSSVSSPTPSISSSFAAAGNAKSTIKPELDDVQISPHVRVDAQVSHTSISSSNESGDDCAATETSSSTEISYERTETPVCESMVLPDSSPATKNQFIQKFEHSRQSEHPMMLANTSSPSVANSPEPPRSIHAQTLLTSPKLSLAGRKAAPPPLNLTSSNLSLTQGQPHQLDSSSAISIGSQTSTLNDVIRGRRRTKRDGNASREDVTKNEEKGDQNAKRPSPGRTENAVNNKDKTSVMPPTIMKSAPHVTGSGPRPTISTSLHANSQTPNGSSVQRLVSQSNHGRPQSFAGHLRGSLPLRASSDNLLASLRPEHRSVNISLAPQSWDTSRLLSAGPLSAHSCMPFSSRSQAQSPHYTNSQVVAEQTGKSSPLTQPTWSTASVEANGGSKVISPSDSLPRCSVRELDASTIDLPPSPLNLPQSPLPHQSRSYVSWQGLGRGNHIAATNNIHTGLTSIDHPGLLLSPNFLPTVEARVFSSRLRPLSSSIADFSERDAVFLLGIYARPEGTQFWTVEKTYQALQALHAQIKSLCSFAGRLPDPLLFEGHAPARIDARRTALDEYFDCLLKTASGDDSAMAICHFLSTNIMDSEKNKPTNNAAMLSEQPNTPASLIRLNKSGYLAKRGKRFGGWKARFFVLEHSELKYYEYLGGPQIGTIKLFKSKIGRQSNKSDESSDEPSGSYESQYRHAFLILEPKKRDSFSLVRHLLCAESDDERDAWVEACMMYTDVPPGKKAHSDLNPDNEFTICRGSGPTLPKHHSSQTLAVTPRKESTHANVGQELLHSPRENHDTELFSNSSNHSKVVSEDNSLAHNHSKPRTEKTSSQINTVGLNYEATVQTEAPSISYGFPNLRSSSSTTLGIPAKHQSVASKEVMISGPTNGSIIYNGGAWGLKAQTPAKEKKRSIFGFAARARSTSDLNVSRPGKESSSDRASAERLQVTISVFGMSLQEAIELSRPVGVDVYLPAVVYRTIEYLRGMGAFYEEGILRLSGSNLIIKNLRERFAQQGDVNLLQDEYCDVHAVASLLKLYLRELPNPILTRDLYLDFVAINNLDEYQKKVSAASFLIHKLPKANYCTLEALCSFLVDVVDNSDRNKMNVRNDFKIIFSDSISEEQPSQPLDLLPSPRYGTFSDTSPPSRTLGSFPHTPSGPPISQPMINHSITQSNISYTAYQPPQIFQSQNHQQAERPGSSQQHSSIHPASLCPNQNAESVPHNHQDMKHSSSTQYFTPQPSADHHQAPILHRPAGAYDTSGQQVRKQSASSERRSNYRESAIMGQDINYAKRRISRPTLQPINSLRQTLPSIF